MNQVQETRTLAERRAAALERLRSDSNLWLATASDGQGPHAQASGARPMAKVP